VTAVDKAKAASATSDAANAKIQAATGGTASTAAPAATKPVATATATAPKKVTATAPKKTGTKTAAAQAQQSAAAAKAKAKVKAAAPVAAKPATTKTSTATTTAKPKTAAKTTTVVDPSDRLLAYLAKGKTLIVLFYGRGADDAAARKAVHQTALKDPKHVVSAYVPIAKVGDYQAITSDVDVLAAPTILVISTKSKATPLTGYVDAAVVRAAVAQARASAAAAK
jgi:hypothetical protein